MKKWADFNLVQIPLTDLWQYRLIKEPVTLVFYSDGLTFSTLFGKETDHKIIIVSLFYTENKAGYSIQIISSGENINKKANLIFFYENTKLEEDWIPLVHCPEVLNFLFIFLQT